MIQELCSRRRPSYSLSRSRKDRNCFGGADIYAQLGLFENVLANRAQADTYHSRHLGYLGRWYPGILTCNVAFADISAQLPA